MRCDLDAIQPRGIALGKDLDPGPERLLVLINPEMRRDVGPIQLRQCE